MYKSSDAKDISQRDFNGGALPHSLECKVLQQLEEGFSFSQEKIEDGGYLQMDSFSHECGGNSLSQTYHDGRFFPTNYLDPHMVKLILRKSVFQNPMKCRGLIWDEGSPQRRSTRMMEGRRHPHIAEWMWWRRRKGLVSHLQIYDTGKQEAWLRWLLLKEFGHHLAYSLSKRSKGFFCLGGVGKSKGICALTGCKIL